MTSTWDPSQYDRFRDERSQPFFDLLSLVERRPEMRIVDLGCGTGELTRRMHDALGAEETVGVDSSETMLAQSALHATGGLHFERADIGAYSPSCEVDLVFSNAALHWLDDHETLFPRIASFLNDEGQLAVQIPANHDHPSHVIAAQIAAEEPFRTALAGHQRRSPVLAPEAYAALLDRLGFERQHVRLQVYAHRLPSKGAVVEWVKGTLLTDYSKRMTAELYESFLARYREALLQALEDRRPYLYPFKRILMWGSRSRA